MCEEIFFLMPLLSSLFETRPSISIEALSVLSLLSFSFSLSA